MSDVPTHHTPVDETPQVPDSGIRDLAAQIDLGDPGTILRFGAAAQQRAVAAADAMLEGARSKDAGEAGHTLSGLLSALKGFDAASIGTERPNLLQRMFTRSGAEVTRILQRYDGVQEQVEAIGDRLDNHRTKLLEDVERLERLYAATLDWFHGLGEHVEAGELVIRRTDEEAIPAAVRRAEDPADLLAPQQLRDLREARDELERRVHDLKLTRQVAMQALPSIRLIQENDKALASKIHSVLANTVPLWRQQLAQALAIHRMREAGQAVKAATDLTNQLLTANAEALRRGNAEARRELERGVFDLEAVQRANAALVGTIEDSLRIAEEARTHRAQASQALERCEAEIRRTLIAAKAPGAKGDKGAPSRRF